MKRVWKIVSLVVLVLILGLAWVMFRPDSYLPHQRITIAVPFSSDNPPSWLIPMGETINHPKPQVPKGHPGIDFAWPPGEAARVLSSSDGVVSSIKQGASEGNLWDVEVKNGYYLLRYKELKDYNHALKKGSSVKTGDYIGMPGTIANGFHWEFASASLLRDRFCPVTYFDPASLALINRIWAQTPNDQMKQQFPYICSGDYYGVED